MNHKSTMYKLEELKRRKRQEVVNLQREISKIEESISHHKRMYILNNKNSYECGEILNGYNRDNVRSILSFMVHTMATRNQEYRKFYKDIDLNELIKNDSFFDFLIVSMGRATIVELKKRMDKIDNIDGEDVLVTNKNKPKVDESLKRRIHKKITKRIVVMEAKRVTMESVA